MTTLARRVDQATGNEAGKRKYDHPDRGCEESPKCITCPLPACKFDGGGGWVQPWKDRTHQLEIVNYVKRQSGSDAVMKRKASAMFNIKVASISRYLRRAEGGELEPFVPPIVHVPTVASKFKRTTINNLRFIE